MKHDDVSPRDLLIRHEMIAHPAPAIAQLVYQQVIAHQQRVHHRFRGNLKPLPDKCDHENGDHDRAEKGLQRTDHILSNGPVRLMIAWEIHFALLVHSIWRAYRLRFSLRM